MIRQSIQRNNDLSEKKLKYGFNLHDYRRDLRSYNLIGARFIYFRPSDIARKMLEAYWHEGKISYQKWDKRNQ